MKKFSIILALTLSSFVLIGQNRKIIPMLDKVEVATPSTFDEVLWYSFDGTLADSTGNFSDASETGSLSWETLGSPPYGTYWRYASGTSLEYATVASSSLNIAGDWTVLFRYDIRTDNATAEWLKGYLGTTSSGVLMRENTTGRDIDIFIGGVEINANNYTLTEPSINFTRSVAVTYDYTSGLTTIYVDGVSKGSGTATTGVALVGPIILVDGAIILFKDFRVVDREMTSGEVSTWHSGGKDKL